MRRVLAWSFVVLATLVAERCTTTATPFWRMHVLCAVAILSLKVVVALESGVTLPVRGWLAFASYPGMRPGIFRTLGGPPREGATSLAFMGVVRLAVGVLLIALARVTWPILVYPGASLVLHFGFVNLAVAAWRPLGVDARPQFRAPLLATTLSDFWARRWNLAFTDMAQLIVARPLGPVLGRDGALFATFLFSGLAHELAISLPVDAGYGGPTLYFVLQGLFVLIERRLGLRGHVWTLACLAVPFPLLFHEPFVRGVMAPLFFHSWTSPAS